MRNHSDMSGFLQKRRRVCAGEKSPCSFQVFTTFLCHWNANWWEWFRLLLEEDSIGEIYSGVNHWASEEEDAIIFSCYILAFFYLTAIATETHWNTRTLPALVKITEDFPGFLIPDFPEVGKSHRDLQVSKSLSCPSGSASSLLQVWQLYKGYELLSTTHKKTLSTLKWEQTKGNIPLHTVTYKHTPPKFHTDVLL